MCVSVWGTEVFRFVFVVISLKGHVFVRFLPEPANNSLNISILSRVVRNIHNICCLFTLSSLQELLLQ